MVLGKGSNQSGYSEAELVPSLPTVIFESELVQHDLDCLNDRAKFTARGSSLIAVGPLADIKVKSHFFKIGKEAFNRTRSLGR